LLLVRPITTADGRDIHRLDGRAQFPKLPALLSLLAHAAVLLTAIVFLPGRLEPPSVPPESSIALVFAPAPAALPSAADVASPAIDDIAPAPAEHSDEAPAAEATPPPVPEVTELPVPAPAPMEPPVPAPLTATPPPAEDTQPSPKERPAPAQKPTPKPAVARAHSAPTSPHAGVAPPHSAEPAEQQSAAVGSTSPAVTAALIPPRPVAGMETNRAPTYPEIARRRGEEGRVVLRVSVSVDGMPLDVEVMGPSGHPSLDSAALLAVRQWRFIPATQAGRSVPAFAEVPVRFRLNN
jgi:periplasmic protein TonB